MFQYTTNIFTFTGHDIEDCAVLTIIPVNLTQYLMQTHMLADAATVNSRGTSKHTLHHL
jgi:hypothetical protein